MNPFFWLLVLLMLGVIWLICSKHFISIGGRFHEIADETNKIINDEIGEE